MQWFLTYLENYPFREFENQITPYFSLKISMSIEVIFLKIISSINIFKEITVHGSFIILAKKSQVTLFMVSDYPKWEN